jgi:hypothetical protein
MKIVAIKNYQDLNNGHLCVKINEDVLIYDGDFENDNYMSKTIKYCKSKDNSIYKIYIGNVNSNYFPEDKNGIFMYKFGMGEIDISCEIINGEIIEYNSYKSILSKNEYDIDWKRNNNGWSLYVIFNNKINIDHCIEKRDNNINITFNNGDIFCGNIIEENNDFRSYYSKCSGKYLFSNNNVYNGIILYLGGKLKFESGVLETYDKNGKKYMMKIYDYFYYSGEICDNTNGINFGYLYLGFLCFLFMLKQKKVKLTMLRLKIK